MGHIKADSAEVTRLHMHKINSLPKTKQTKKLRKQNSHEALLKKRQENKLY